MKEIPFNLTEFLRTTTHQNLIVDLTSNILSTISCSFLQIPTILTLILTDNQLECLPSCFSRSAIEYLHLKHNRLQFNQSTILASSKLLHLDLSENNLSSLPRTFFAHLRRLQRLIIDGNENLFLEQNNRNQQWIRSLNTRNQLTLIICKANFRLSLCLFDNLFQTKKLLSLELNANLHCDCSLVHLPIDRIHFQYCQSEQQQGVCNDQSSPFEPGRSIYHVQNSKYRQICTEEYHACRSPSTASITTRTTTTETYSSSSMESSFNNPSIITSTMLTTTTTITTILSKKENMTTGAIVSFVLILLIVSIICLYVILSGHLFQMKNRRRTTDLMVRKKEQQVTTATECIPIDNLNTNFNPQRPSFLSYYHRTNSSSDDDNDQTFYSLNETTNPSSTSFLQTSITEMEIASTTSTIDSSFSNDTVVISNHHKQRIY